MGLILCYLTLFYIQKWFSAIAPGDKIAPKSITSIPQSVPVMMSTYENETLAKKRVHQLIQHQHRQQRLLREKQQHHHQQQQQQPQKLHLQQQRQHQQQEQQRQEQQQQKLQLQLQLQQQQLQLQLQLLQQQQTEQSYRGPTIRCRSHLITVQNPVPVQIDLTSPPSSPIRSRLSAAQNAVPVQRIGLTSPPSRPFRQTMRPTPIETIYRLDGGNVCSYNNAP